MTRLIDADKLIEEFKGRCICNCDRCKYQRGAYCGLIDLAPTVEERQKGAWESGGFCFSTMSYKCPFCKSKTLERTKFCSECGADMREADNDKTN